LNAAILEKGMSMNEEDNLVNLVALPERDADQAAADDFRRRLPALIQNTQSLAKLRRASYLAHIEEGFTPEQALLLCTK
jgi:hypothetical protein